MDKISTQNLFTKSLYETLSPSERRKVKLLPESSVTQQQQSAKQFLDSKPLKAPSETSIQIILEYSQKQSQFDTIS